MVKPVFLAATKIREAETADEAFQAALLFLSSPEASNVNPSQAGTFLKDVEAAFLNHKAVKQYELLLQTTGTLRNPSSHIKAFAASALNELRDVKKYVEEAFPVHIQTGKILKGFAEPKPTGFQFATHYAAPSDEPDVFCAYPELLKANNARDLADIVEKMMLDKDVSGEDVPVFFEALMDRLQTLEVPTDQQIELLDSVQLNANNKALSILAFNRATVLAKENPTPSQGQANLGGLNPSMP